MENFVFANWLQFVNYVNSNKLTTFVADTLSIESSYEDLPNYSSVYAATKHNTTIESIVIRKLVLVNHVTIGTMFQWFENLKILIINSIQADHLKNCSCMFRFTKCNYLEVNLTLPTVEACNNMFSDVNVQSAKLNLKFSNKLGSAVEMFSNWITLSPVTVESLVTYDANIDNIFTGCAFSQPMLAKLKENNRKAKLTKEQSQVESIESAITSTIRKLVLPRIESVFVAVQENKNDLMSSINNISNVFDTKLNQSMNNISRTVDTRINNFNQQLSESRKTISTIESKLNQNIANSIKSLNDSLNELEKQTKGNDGAIHATATTLQSIVELADRLQTCLESVDQRVETLEHPSKFEKFTEEEVATKVDELIDYALEVDNNIDLRSKDFQKELFDKFQQIFGWKKIEFVVLRRIIEKQTTRAFYRQYHQ